MKDIPKGSYEGEKGTWWNDFKNDDYVKRRNVLAWVACPSCGVVSELSGKVHKVADDGTVSPSFVCPHTMAWPGHEPCTFHEWVRLLDWKDP